MDPHASSSAPALTWLQWLWHGVPNAIAFAMLAGVFVLGHHYEWKLPKFSELMSGPPEEEAKWCEPHGVPEEVCVECKPELDPQPKPVGFCKIHGVAECVLCNPSLAQTKDAPKVPQYDTAAALALMPRHTNNSRSPLIAKRVQFMTAEAVDRAGVEIAVVGEERMVEAISANGEVVFDPTHVAHLSAKSPGIVALALKKTGDRVTAGETLALIDAAAVGQAKSQLATALVQLRTRTAHRDRLKAAAAALPGRSVLEAEAAVQEADVAVLSARQALINLGFAVPEEIESLDAAKLTDKLRFLGLSDNDVGLLPPTTRTANLFPLAAPFDGVVVAADTVAGEVVEPGKSLFTIADPDRLWLKLAVPEDQVRYVKLAMPIEFTVIGSPGMKAEPVAGKVSWISPTVNERTRMVEVRVVVENAAGKLRQGAFGTAKIILRDEPHAIVVPRDAVQTNADGEFVFVRDKRYFDPKAPKLFLARQVRTGARDGKQVELLAGVLPGEVVAARGSTVLMAQLLKANLGAGCGCH